MSIIYGTLERLETDQQPPVNPEQFAQPPAQDKRRQGSLLRSLTTGMLFALAAANLVLWYWSHSSSNGPVTTLTSVAPAPELSPATVPATTQLPEYAASTAASPTTATAPVSENAAAIPEQEASPLQGSTDETLSRAVPSNGESSVTTVSPVTSPTRESLTGSAVLVSTQPAAGAVPVSEKSEAGTESVVKAQPVTVTPGKTSRVESAKVVQAGTANARHPSEHTASRAVVAVPQPSPADDVIAPVAVDTAVEEARLALSRGRYHGALAALQALQPTPQNRADFWLIKGSAHLGAGQLELAEASLSSARELAPNNARIAIQMAILKQEMGDHESALQILGSVADRHPDVPEIYLNQGFSQQATGAETAAKRSFRIFLRLTEGRSLYSRQRMAIEEWLSAES